MESKLFRLFLSFFFLSLAENNAEGEDKPCQSPGGFCTDRAYSLCELQGKMREAENDAHDGKRKCETLWPIFKIAHQKSRYVFDLYHQRKEISEELYEFCLDQGFADRNLIAKW